MVVGDRQAGETALTARSRRLLVPVIRAQNAGPLLTVADAMLRLEGGGGQVLGVVEAGPDRLAHSLTVARVLAGTSTRRSNAPSVSVQAEATFP